MPAKIALNVITDTIQAIDDLDDGTKFVTHKPRLPPYQAPEFKSRVLWVHTSAGYVVWMAGGKLLLVSESAVPQGDNDTHAIAVGEFINDYIFDKTTYATALATYKGMTTVTTVTKHTVTTTHTIVPPSKKHKPTPAANAAHASRRPRAHRQRVENAASGCLSRPGSPASMCFVEMSV